MEDYILTRFSISILVRLFLLILCIILFTIIFKLAEEPTTPEELDTALPPLESLTPAPKSDSYVLPTLSDSPALYLDVEYVKPITYDDAVEQVGMINFLINDLEYACSSGLYNLQAIDEILFEINRLEGIKAILQTDIKKFIYWESEYKYATKVWYFLRENGFSEEVSAGIIGNMMIETSGGDLALNPFIFNPTSKYYGLCQWSVQYHPDVINKPFDEQLRYLLDTLSKEFKTFGNKYSTGFTYNDFLELETPEEAAHAFAVVYERCDPAGYTRRKQAAKVAYEYFTSEVE